MTLDCFSIAKGVKRKRQGRNVGGDGIKIY